MTQERTCEQKASKRPGTVKRPRCWRFSIGSAPLTSITKIDAQVRGGETRQDYKGIPLDQKGTPGKPSPPHCD
ncbi:hypothetical protein ACOWY5_28145, partial [Klebsiella pneumoniae]